MNVREYHTSELDEFVAACDRVGGIAHPDAAPLMAAYALRFDTKPDETLDPFSDEYFRQQAALYTELSGRPVDQEQGEMTPVSVDDRVAGTNPYNVRDVRFIAKHTRTVHASLVLANLPAGAKILDAGCGWGLSSEAMAFCGADVTALDINPLFVELVRRRAERLGLPIRPARSEFGAFETAERFDLLFFYECLHHSLKPWETIAHLGQFVKPDGKVVIAGEPLNAIWWKDWGMRLDPLSVYCIRKFGWWESGWSHEFLARSFARAGFTLTYHPHLGLENGQIGFACRQGREADVVPDLGMYWSIDQALAHASRQAAERDGKAAAVRHDLAQRQQELSARDAILGELRAQAAEREGRLVELAATREAARLQANQYRHEADQKDGRIAALERSEAETRAAMVDLLTSRSWRITAPLRGMFRRLGLSLRR